MVKKGVISSLYISSDKRLDGLSSSSSSVATQYIDLLLFPDYFSPTVHLLFFFFIFQVERGKDSWLCVFFYTYRMFFSNHFPPHPPPLTHPPTHDK
jgi:hypothetical protein